ncbi:MAG: chemotaxis response regulator protein-glutamate methylesterase [Deltaproteobacteria bacterium]
MLNHALKTTEQKQIKVLIVDDSAVVRQTLTHILSLDSSIVVIGAAQDPFIAAERIKQEAPDVIMLDIEMPRMDGLTFLHKIMSQHPIPVVICSSLAESGSETAFKALEYGAVEVIAKPKLGTMDFLEESRIRICDAVKAASQARLTRINARELSYRPKLSADAVLPKATMAMIQTTEKVIVIGASTGGTEALKEFLCALPPDSPGIVIVQHMPEKFTATFAKHLDDVCGITVKEAEDNDTVLRGRALLAPGNKHMILKRSGARYYVNIKDGPLVSRHRPSVDVLFRSAAQYAGSNAVGVILTGMGDDGAKGLLEMRQTGAYNIAQDEATSIVFGMPREAIKLNAAQAVLPLNQIANEAMRRAR